MNDTVEAEHPELRKWLSTLLDSPRSQSRLCDFWMNAQQLERVNSLQPRELLLTSIGREEVHETVAAVLWPILTSTPVYLISDGDHSMPEGIRQIAGSDFLRRRLYSLVPNTRTPFYDFRPGSPQHRLEALLRHGPRHYPGHVHEEKRLQAG